MLRYLLKLFLLLLSVSYLYPLFFMLKTSLSSATGFDTGFYTEILGAGNFLIYFTNSLVILFFVLAGNLTFNLMVAYALSRMKFRGKGLLFAFILLTLMVPKQILLIPSFILIKELGLLDTLTGLCLPFLVDGFNIFLLKQFLEQIPLDLEESARIDGANERIILTYILIPLLKGPLFLVAINTAIVNWNSFIYPLIFISSDKKRTLPLALALLGESQFSVSWGHLMAGAAIVSLPLILLFFIFQKRIVSGILEGGLKG
ncbi:carbohydrate ABC transporter permease [Candidatus Riflebacteria bacterium]